MQHFVIPQFIDEESHVLGPITVRQFVIMLVVGLLVFLSYRFADLTLFILSSIIIVAVGSAIAFIRVNGRPFHYFLLNLVQTLGRPRLRVWRKEFIRADDLDAAGGHAADEGVVTALVRERPQVTSSRLSELALVVDTGGAYRSDSLE